MAPESNRNGAGRAFPAPARVGERQRRVLALGLFAALTLLPAATAQTTSDMREILDRLDRLEAQNRALLAKVDALQAELAAARGGVAAGTSTAAGAPASQPTLDERLAVQESRTAEQAQSKVEASEKFPIRLTGMVLFNAYRNSENSGGSAFPTAAAAGGPTGGGTFRQTVIGLEYFGPTTFWNGKISGSAYMDFYGGSGRLLSQYFRLRTASISIDWKNRGFKAALDTALLATRQPESLAQVGISPLTGAGNLWLWLPQARFEQVFHLSQTSGIRAQVAAIETNEAASVYGGAYASGPPPSYALEVEPARPGVEGRVEFFSGGDDRRFEIAPAFHHSVAHAAGASVPTNIYALDWFARPMPGFEFTGTVFTGTNTAALGGLQQGIVALAPGSARAVHSTGGWGEFTWRPTSRIWFNVFSGEEDPHYSDLPGGAIGKNMAYGANVFYRIAPNVLTSFEIHQYRTSYVGAPQLLSNHYDLGLGYRF